MLIGRALVRPTNHVRLVLRVLTFYVEALLRTKSAKPMQPTTVNYFRTYTTQQVGRQRIYGTFMPELMYQGIS